VPWRDGNGMAMHAENALTGDRAGPWWPSRYGADVRQYLLVISHAKPCGATGAWVAPLATV